MQKIKKWAAIAGCIQDALQQVRHSRYRAMTEKLARFNGKFRELSAASHRLDLAVNRRWHAASESCYKTLGMLLDDIEFHRSRLKPLITGANHEVPSQSELVAELMAAEQEFGEIEFNKDLHSISVFTEPITLEDIYLGSFEIRLSILALGRIYERSPYGIIAVDPNPAASDDTITHPHVSGETLCEGEASAAIQAALEHGRLLDFFTLVRSVLNTYNPGSPYVQLSAWDGMACYDCGCTYGSESLYYCDRCEHDYCEECSTWCRQCQETVCLSCSVTCGVCGESFCRGCANDCPQCGKPMCSDCIENGICANCATANENEEDDDHEEEPIQSTETQSPNQGQSEIRLAG